MQKLDLRFPLAALCAVVALASCGGNNGANNGANNATNNGGNNAADLGGMTDSGSDVGGTDAGVDMATVECGEPTGMRPPRLSEHAGAYVPAAAGRGAQLAVFGGSLGIPENCGFPQRTYETTTWLYDIDCDSWSKLAPASTPGGRARHTAVYDANNDRMIVFGGLSAGSTLNDTWAFDMTSHEWSKLTTTGGPPPARMNHTAAFDPTGRMLVFGGNVGSSVVNITVANDVWALDLETNEWSDVTPAAAGPDPRLWVSALFDADRSQFVIFGGGDDSAFTGTVEYFNDAWAWSDAGGTPTWTEVAADSAIKPDGRFWSGFTYDEVGQQYVMFGGHDATSLGNRNDTWFLDPDSGQWAENRGGDTYNKPPNGQCDFPPDFATIDDGSPERRNAHVFVSGDGFAYALAGKTDCGVVDDLARLDLASGEWENLTRATAGEVCLRKGGGDTCSGLCL